MIIIANHCLLSFSSKFFSRLLFISQCKRAFNCMSMDNSTSYFSSPILSFSKDLSSDILYTLSCCQCFRISISKIVVSIVFRIQIKVFDNQRTNNSALAFLVISANITPHAKYFIYQKCISTFSSTLANTLFGTSIRSASDNCQPVILCEKRISLLWYKTFRVDFMRCYRLTCDFYSWLRSKIDPGSRLGLRLLQMYNLVS